MKKKTVGKRVLKVILLTLLTLILIIVAGAGVMSIKVHTLFKDIDTADVISADMLIDTYGNPENPSLLLLHGMYMDGSMLSDYGEALSDEYYVIVPTFHGMEGATQTVFDSFDEECSSIEEYVKNQLDGHLDYAYGISMGATAIYHLLERDQISIDKAVLDGLYVARQGEMAAYMTSTHYYKFHEKALAGEDFDLGIMKIGCKLMGMSEEDAKALIRDDMTKNHMTLENMSRAAYANYTFQVDENTFISQTEVTLWCGSEEPYALKSNAIVKPHLEHFDEKIYEGYGHGEFISKHEQECIADLRKIFKKG